MSSFIWHARAASGQLVRGELQAPDEARARQLLVNNGLTPVTIHSKSADSFLTRALTRGRVKTKDLIVFSRQVSVMVKAGVPILQVLRSLLQQANRLAWRTVLQRLITNIEDGDSLSLAMAKHPAVFSPFFLGLIRTGEASGKLHQSMTTLADYLEQEYVFRRKILAALIYPALIVVTMFVVTLVIFAFVLPQLVELFADAKVTLPLPTRIVMAVTNIWISYWYVGLLLVGTLAVVGRFYLRTPEGRYTVSSLALQLPVIKGIMQRIYLARLTSMLHTLLSSAVPLLEALDLVEQAIGNKVYQRIMQNTVQAVKDGSLISSVWEYEPFIPPLLSTIVSTGEHSGQIDTAFAEANRFFRREVDEAFNFITVLLEPLMVIVLGIGVAILVAAVFLPIYNLVLTF